MSGEVTTPVHVVQPDQGESFWQPVSANGMPRCAAQGSGDPELCDRGSGQGPNWMRSTGVEPDDRIAEAIALVEKNRRSDERWPLQNPHVEQLDFDMAEGAGQPSR